MAKRWYVVHAYSGFEKHVKRSLFERIKRAAMEEEFGEILVPTEEVVEMRGGQKRKSERKFFPGYVLVQMEMNEATWHLVKDCPKVMGFIGGTADKAHHFRAIFNQMPSGLVHFHLDQHIARKELAFTFAFLAATHFNYFFGWHQNFAKFFFHRSTLDSLKQRALHMLFKTRIGMNHIPPLCHFQPQPLSDDAGNSGAQPEIQ